MHSSVNRSIKLNRVWENRCLRTWERTSRSVPLIVLPITDKLTYCQPNIVRAIWTEAEFAIRTAPRIFCLGYSLPVTDWTVRYLLSSIARKQGNTEFFA